MPRIAEEGMEEYKLGGGFSFTGASLDSLGASEYTLVTIVLDYSGSVERFESDLRKALVTAVDSCRRSPRSNNLLLRVVIFSSAYGINEIHGFKPLSQIDPMKDYSLPRPDGVTNLFDASFDSIASMATYGQELKDNDFLANGIVFIVTDGDDNNSTLTPGEINKQVSKIRQEELLESIHTVLIGINAAKYKSYLEKFVQDGGLNQFVDVGDATPGKLAKLAAFVSHSVSSQSQALGTGGPSQSIAPAI